MLRQMTTRSCIQHINLRRVVEDIFSLPISTFSALEVGHVMRYINARYLFTYFFKTLLHLQWGIECWCADMEKNYPILMNNSAFGTS